MKSLGRTKKGAVSKRGASAEYSPRVSVGKGVSEVKHSVIKHWRVILSLPWKGMLKVSTFCAVIAGLWVGQQIVWQQLDQPITGVDLKGSLINLDENDLRPVLSKALGKGFFSVDIAMYREVIELQPWIAKASIKRVWPEKLEVLVEEEVPVARWNNASLLNPYGQVFTPDIIGEDNAHLPKLSGPEGQEVDVLKQYVSLHELLEKSEISILALNLEARGAWQLTVNDGLPVMLGRTHIEERLQRFVKVYKKHLKDNRDKVKLVDARYTNGVSIAWNFKPVEKKES